MKRRLAKEFQPKREGGEKERENIRKLLSMKSYPPYLL